MINKQKICELIISIFIQTKEDGGDFLYLNINNDTVLMGQEEILDSLGIVNLIVAVEEKVEEEFSVAITLADERAMSQKDSPFRTIGTLVDYISLLIEENERK